MSWIFVAVLPNIYTFDVFDGEGISITHINDPRVKKLLAGNAHINLFLQRFQDAFKTTLTPAILISRQTLAEQLRQTNAFASFRDLLVASIVPHARSQNIVYKMHGERIHYANSFWLYPWTPSDDTGHMVMTTPAVGAFHLVKEFHGQSNPEISVQQLRRYDLDEPLFKALTKCWKRHYLGKRSRWADRALFRSLNMAMHACMLPSGADTTLYDLGRICALWISAFEIISRPYKGYAGLNSVYPLLESVAYQDKNFRRKRREAFMGKNKKKPWARRPFSCWVYGELYKARNTFLHGNPITKKLMHPKGSKLSLFWLAASLYRLALTGALPLKFKSLSSKNPKVIGKFISEQMEFYEPQLMAERALLRARK